ncbi:hypothetical protein CgunFtcFv8_027877 [Champsocephalus gunnari]|uniref:Uncharacterized protein n=1 Tax=Champsocephalus gunnari TaxID=52237 RepID=A0AAN8E6X4_CHAGU|nr:hypothetical protein CgunFtcFv8_027877 [Champsocephalus gunnari]
MDQLDAVAVSILRAANISEGTMSTLSREDLRDLFPRPRKLLSEKSGSGSKETDAGVDTPDTDSPATMANPNSTLQTLSNRSTNIDSPDTDSRASMAKHYRTLQAWDIRHAMGELRRLLDKDNSHSIDEMLERWQDFCQKVQFYGVWKKMLKPPLGMDKAEQAIRILRVLPSLFPSPCAPPKKLRDASEALLHVLEVKEDPNSYLKKRPLPCPVLIVSSSSCLLAIVPL